jgi:hypothetical protein
MMVQWVTATLYSYKLHLSPSKSERLKTQWLGYEPPFLKLKILHFDHIISLRVHYISYKQELMFPSKALTRGSY